MIQLLDLLCYGLVLLFGIAVSVSFSGVGPSRKNMVGTGGVFLLTLSLQIIALRLAGMERTKELYPLIVHLPLVLFLVFYNKRPWLVSLSSVFSAYLCCQIPKWFGLTAEILFRTPLAYCLSYIPAILLCLSFLCRQMAAPVNRIITQSKKSCLLFGAVPFLYYGFDYVSTIYTDWLYSGSKAAVQFIPSMFSISLENAITAASAVPRSEVRIVSIQITVYKEKLLLSVENPYVGNVVLREGLPRTDRKEHGYGTRSISAIAELHGGQALFSANSGIFSLKVMIHLK